MVPPGAVLRASPGATLAATPWERLGHQEAADLLCDPDLDVLLDLFAGPCAPGIRPWPLQTVCWTRLRAMTR